MIVKVFTKYDNIPERVIYPCIRKLTKRELKPLTNYDQYFVKGFMVEKSLLLKRIIYGLEGVKFVHYGRKYEHGLG